MNASAAAAVAAPPLSLSLIGVPNCGKTALFNRLTGSRQKVANYPGVTVERKEGRLTGPQSGRSFRVVDLPGAYSLEPATLDEAIARDVVLGRHASEPPPDLLVCVVDATNLRLNLRLVLELKRLGRPMIVALNMSDVAEQRGYQLDRAALERALGIAVVPTVAVRSGGDARAHRGDRRLPLHRPSALAARTCPAQCPAAGHRGRHRGDAARGAARTGRERLPGAGAPGRARAPGPGGAAPGRRPRAPRHRAVPDVPGGVLVGEGAAEPDQHRRAGRERLPERAPAPPGPLRGLLLDGVVAGTGSVLVFLPQILILFFILALEDSGYLPRAAFMLDRLMGRVGLSGRAFIPLLSSFACAIPGIMAARTIPSNRDRIATIMIAPLMTCSRGCPCTRS